MTAPQSEATPERRKARRSRALKHGSIVFNDGRCSMSCQIVEVSDTGAKLIPNDPFNCPSEFVLMPLVGEPHQCEVRWRRGTKVGVRYLSAPTIDNAIIDELSVGDDARMYPSPMVEGPSQF